jgi:RimJ/RimL family protein N-acetyltransferase
VSGVKLPSDVLILETQRLELRIWSEHDLESGVAIWGDPEVMKLIGSGKAMSRADVRRSIEAGTAHQRKYGVQHWAVKERASGEIIGCCGFNKLEDSDALELVFHFAKAHWGHGYATEAAEACVSYARRVLRPQTIVAWTHPLNGASRRILEKLGFEQRGHTYFEDSNLHEPRYELDTS